MSSPTDFDFALSPSPSPSAPPSLSPPFSLTVPTFWLDTTMAQPEPNWPGVTTAKTATAVHSQNPAGPFLVKPPAPQLDAFDELLQSLVPDHGQLPPQDVLSQYTITAQMVGFSGDAASSRVVPVPFEQSQVVLADETVLDSLIMSLALKTQPAPQIDSHAVESMDPAEIPPLQDERVDPVVTSNQVTDHGPTAAGGGDHELADAMTELTSCWPTNVPGQHHLEQVAAMSAPTHGTTMPATAVTPAMPMAMISASATATATSPVGVHGVNVSVSSTALVDDLVLKTAAVHDSITQVKTALQAMHAAKTALGASLAQAKDVAAETLTWATIEGAKRALDAQPHVQETPSATAAPFSTHVRASLAGADATAANATHVDPIANQLHQDADGDESMEDGDFDADTSASVSNDADRMINTHTNHYKLKYKGVPNKLYVPRPFKVPAPLSNADQTDKKKRNAHDAALSRARRWALLRFFEDECIRLSAKLKSKEKPFHGSRVR